MARVLRTSIRPGKPVEHECRDVRGDRVRGKAPSSSYCEKCNTQIVYVFDNTPKKDR